jgi:hypothetical protein
MLRDIKGTQRLPRLLAFAVDGTGTAAIGEGSRDATLTDNGAGDYTLTYSKAFARAPIVIVTTQTADTRAEVPLSANLAASCQILTKNDGTTPTDAEFLVLVLGWDTADRF